MDEMSLEVWNSAWASCMQMKRDILFLGTKVTWYFCFSQEVNEWFASNQIPILCAKGSGIARGQTLQVARRKCVAKSCFDVQENDFGERSTLFRCYFIDNGSGQCWYMESVSFHLNNREICDQKLPIISLVKGLFIIAKFTLNRMIFKIWKHS